MTKLIFSILLFFLLTGANGQSGIDYKHKKITKEIEKLWGIEQANIVELPIPDSIKKENYIQGKYFAVADKMNVSQIYYMYIGRVNSCRAGGCSIPMDSNENFESEYFDYFILFDSAISVHLVRVFNYAATHGHEVSAKGWLKQFDGYDGTDTLRVGKNVDAISGATISVYGITEDVQLKTQIMQALNKQIKISTNLSKIP
ncbi:MAG: FMN-binding protein [Deltaproteobacteria bacterium]|nr:MAG: FMN-binding protein [Deltaproteobacteria bacterium]